MTLSRAQIHFDEARIRHAADLEKMMSREFGEAAQAALAHYTANQLPTGRKRVRTALDGLAKDMWYSAATWHFADVLASAPSPPDVYVYHFTQKVHQCAVPCLPKMAWHGCDTPFWNGEEPVRPRECDAHRHPRPSASPLGRTMVEYLLRFAATGSPNGPGLPAWDAHRQGESGRCMQLGASIGMVDLPETEVERHDLVAREWFGKRLKTELRRGEEQEVGASR